jgi:hypothetical protein
MGFNISEMRSELRIHLGNLSTTALPNPDADLLINRSWWQCQNSLGFEELKNQRSFSTVVGTNSYALNPTVDEESIRSLSYYTESGQSVPIYPIKLDEYAEKYSTDENLRGAPENYFREGDNIILWPDPDDVYDIVLYYLATLDDWNDANPENTIPQSAHEIVLYGAVWRGYDRLGNLGRGSSFMDRQKSMIVSYVPPAAKDQNAHQYARVIPLRSRYP